jgi:hypothetical protein
VTSSPAEWGPRVKPIRSGAAAIALREYPSKADVFTSQLACVRSSRSSGAAAIIRIGSSSSKESHGCARPLIGFAGFYIRFNCARRPPISQSIKTIEAGGELAMTQARGEETEEPAAATSEHLMIWIGHRSTFQWAVSVQPWASAANACRSHE